MGQAKIRADRRREALAEGKPEPTYAPKVPQLVTFNFMVGKNFADQIERRRSVTTYTPAQFIEQLLIAGIRAFDQEVQQIQAQQQSVTLAKPGDVAKVAEKADRYVGRR